MAEEVIYTSSYYPGALATRVVNLIFGIIEFLLLVRIVLELLGANPAAPFIAWIYSVTGSLLGPFVNAFPNFTLVGNSVIDVVAILGMIAYAVIGWLILQICWAVLGSL